MASEFSTEFFSANRIVKADLRALGGIFPQVHEDLILDAAGGVGGQLDVLVGPKGVDGLDEADGADGDQVLLVGGLRVILLDDVGHQAQIVLHQYIPGLQISGGTALQALPLPGSRQGLGE